MTSPYLMCGCVLLIHVTGTNLGSPRDATDVWTQIRSFDNPPEGNPDLIAFLKSLSPAQMLTAARQASDEAAKFASDGERAAAGDFNVIFCLEYYFENSADRDMAAQRLLAIVSDKTESPWFRRAILVAISSGRKTSFLDSLISYVTGRMPAFTEALEGVLTDPQENPWVRRAGIESMHSLISEQARVVYMSDSNVLALNRRTGRAVAVGEMVRSGELTLTDRTKKALEPIETRVHANAELLGQILGNEDESKELRLAAKRALKGYLRLPLNNFEPIERALEHRAP